MRLYSGRTTLSKFLIDQLADQPDHGQLAGLLVDVAAAIKAIAVATAKGALVDTSSFATATNVQGEQQVPLDVLADELVIEHCEWSGLLAGMASEEREEPIQIPEEFQRGPYLLLFDPLDGSSNVAVNVSIGTIFSVLKHKGAGTPGAQASTADFLQAGTEQLAAGYAVYGPATMLVLTVGKGVHGFTLDREIGNFVLTHPEIRIPEETSEFAINTSNERFWEPPVQRYVSECKAGSTGIRARDFNMRWIATMVVEVHRILMRGGVFMYPQDQKLPRKPGRLRLMYEANPVAMLVEQAGGRASTGRQRLLEVVPESLHQRVPVILGSSQEILRIEAYHEAYDTGCDKPYVSPLFHTRSLYRAEA